MSDEPQIVLGPNRPRLRTLDADLGERHASWLELFFDLVFVLAVAQLARILTDNSDLIGFLRFAVLFLPVWYLWVGFTFYADRFETEEATYRILMFSGMLAVTGLSLTLGTAFTPSGDVAFVVCYTVVRLVLLVLYARAAYYIPLARPYCIQFVSGLAVSSTLTVVSLLLPSPWRYAVWAAALLFEFGIPFMNIRATRLIPIDRSHIPERLGLFTIIVLGEAVIATATGAASAQWNFTTIMTASLAFAIAASIWWINFDFVEDNAIRSGSLAKRFLFLYSHFFMIACIVAIGIGAEHAIKEATEAHLHLPSLALLAGGIAVYLTVITIVRLVTGICRQVVVRMISIAISLSLLYLGNFLPPIAVVATLVFVMVGNILIESRFLTHEEEESEAPHLSPCSHAVKSPETEPRTGILACEECVKNNYKWVHLRLCLSCGHVGCCDSSKYKHATKHYHDDSHPIMCSLEPKESWAWCYEDERFVPVPPGVSTDS